MQSADKEQGMSTDLWGQICSHSSFPPNIPGQLSSSSDSLSFCMVMLKCAHRFGNHGSSWSLHYFTHTQKACMTVWKSDGFGVLIWEKNALPQTTSRHFCEWCQLHLCGNQEEPMGLIWCSYFTAFPYTATSWNELREQRICTAWCSAGIWPGEREADTEVGVLVPTQWAVPAAAMAHSSTCHYLQGRALPTRKHCPARACRGEAATALLGISLSLT